MNEKTETHNMALFCNFENIALSELDEKSGDYVIKELDGAD